MRKAILVHSNGPRHMSSFGLIFRLLWDQSSFTPTTAVCHSPFQPTDFPPRCDGASGEPAAIYASSSSMLCSSPPPVPSTAPGALPCPREQPRRGGAPSASVLGEQRAASGKQPRCSVNCSAPIRCGRSSRWASAASGRWRGTRSSSTRRRALLGGRGRARRGAVLVARSPVCPRSTH
jgi:hypothetical protein